jgi:hypothetical protein
VPGPAYNEVWRRFPPRCCLRELIVEFPSGALADLAVQTREALAAMAAAKQAALEAHREQERQRAAANHRRALETLAADKARQAAEALERRRVRENTLFFLCCAPKLDSVPEVLTLFPGLAGRIWKRRGVTRMPPRRAARATRRSICGRRRRW